MRLLRAVIISLVPTPRLWNDWPSEIAGVSINVCVLPWHDSRSTNLLVIADLALQFYPDVDAGLVQIPRAPLRQLETAIELLGNMISIGEHCSRELSSPTPCVALLSESIADVEWLGQKKGFKTQKIAYPSGKHSISPAVLQDLDDRPDGVALLAESLSVGSHASARFRELIRFFERAFAASSLDLIRPLAQFLDTGPFQYTEAEVRGWLELRGPVVHADRRPSFSLEADVFPFVHRMEQAGYDVLFNKQAWHTKSSERRPLWSPSTGSLGDADIFGVIGHNWKLDFVILDDVGRYRRNLDGFMTDPPQSWWIGEPA